MGLTPDKAAIEEAKKRPNGCVYKIEGEFPPDATVPPDAIVGFWKVDASGKIVGEFVPNPAHRPKR
jgi:hypothetical protein